MDTVVDFDLNDALKNYLSDPASIPTPDADGRLIDCEIDPESFTNTLINSVLNPIVDAVTENPESVQRGSIFDSLQFLLKCAPTFLASQRPSLSEPNSELFRLCRLASHLPTYSLSKILDLLISGLSSESEVVHNDLDADEQDSPQHHRKLLQMFAFLLQWTISAVEVKAAEKHSVNVPAKSRGSAKAGKTKSTAKDGTWDSAGQLQIALETMCKVMRLNLGTIFVTTSERDSFVGLFTRSVYLILENEQRIKNTALRMHAFKNLSYFEHLAEPMAEFLHILSEQYDYPQLVEEVLRELANKEFNNNDTKGPKSVSAFMIKLSELTPRLVNKQMTLLVKQLDSEAYTLRCAIIEVCGNLIADLSKQEERNENSKTQINSFFDILEERFLDTNPYCRCRDIQVCMKLCELEQKFPKRRQKMAELAARSLEDKSSNVRRNAIKLLAKMVSTHPFSAMHGGQLSLQEWEQRLQAVETELNALKPPAGSPGLAQQPTADEENVDTALLDDVTTVETEQQETVPISEEEKAAAFKKAAEEEAATSETMTRLQLTRKYYTEALRFIEVCQEAAAIVCQLLSSKNKSEVIEAMDFFVIMDAYKIEAARTGVRRMLRLIWTKGNSDEGKGVQSHLIDCYRGLFFSAPDGFSENDAANYVARNMISLSFGSSPAELTSLEQLLSMMMKAEHVPVLVVQKLWQVYGVQRQEISKSQRRGAIIVLGMLAMADPEIVVKEMGTLLRIGLGQHGREDLVLAKYSCVALQRINPANQKSHDSKTPFSRLLNDHAVLVKLASMFEVVSDSKEWFGMAEQSIGAIYALSKHPDTLCSEILRRKTRFVFQQTQPFAATVDIEGRSGMLTPPPEELGERQPQNGTLALSQLLFTVGHIAIKQIVHLELCELDFKRRKAEREKTKAPNASPKKGANTEPDDLDLIGGTTEDDFTEAMNHIRERELLYGPNSLLSNFGPLVTEICSNNTAYDDEGLQAAATLCLAKLMCVSSEFCEGNLPLLITILEKSQNAITRSNVVIALGDMAVCFNHLIDENTDFLYRRLNDGDASVKRTCLMTLTFLILAGQVKVKGQLGEMAKCLEDSDKQIADLARLFFTELATKDNAIYNHFIDMFSLLTAGKELEDDALKRIIKFLSSFIEKDKHAKQLADKLAARLARCDNEKQWNDTAYALSLLQHKNEEIQKTVSAGFRLVQGAAA